MINQWILLSDGDSEGISGMALHLATLDVPIVGHNDVAQDARNYFVGNEQLGVVVIQVLLPELVGELEEVGDVLAQVADGLFDEGLDFTQVDVHCLVSVDGVDALLV